jgi:protein-S-isoprenylcysteine O-methyltransferase Ste14
MRIKNTILSRILSIILLPFMVLVVVPLILLIFAHPRLDPLDITYPLVVIPIIIGIMLFISGLLLLVTTIRIFHELGKGTLAPWDPPRKLVIKGPYRYIRNPMIAGVLIALLGEAVLTFSPVLLMWFIFFFILNIIYFICMEEPVLEKRFGDDYKLYKKKVPMFIPRLRRYK